MTPHRPSWLPPAQEARHDPHSKRRPTPEERFWRHVEKLDGPDACWLWTGRTRGGGERRGDPYGGFTFRGREAMAHRVSFELHFGPIPAGMCVCHRCDRTLCVRPDHLFLGTHADNARDRNWKRRHAFGHRNGKVKTTVSQVQEIRRLRSDGLTMPEIARLVGTTVAVVDSVVRGRTWKWVQ